MSEEDNVLEIWGSLPLRHSHLLPLYFVRGLSPERAIRAVAADEGLRKPLPMLLGNKTQRQEWGRQSYSQ